jgi:thiol-disulfide isomerase/thioredoxin
MTAGALPVESRMPGFSGSSGWLNSAPLTPDALCGKVVAVQFWTFTCINWLRTLPYVRGWVQTYGEHGLVFIGAHTPEFNVEHDVERVRRSLVEMGIDYPVVIDNDYAIWDGFANRYWPALFLADAHGRLRYHHFGEGGYEQTEDAIRQLLSEAGVASLPAPLSSVAPRGIEVPADWQHLGTPRPISACAARRVSRPPTRRDPMNLTRTRRRRGCPSMSGPCLATG